MKTEGMAAIVILLAGTTPSQAGHPRGSGQGCGAPATGAVPGAAVGAAVPLPSYGVFAAGPIAGPGPTVINYNPPIVYVPGPFGWEPYAPPLVVVGPGGGFPQPAAPLPPPLRPVAPRAAPLDPVPPDSLPPKAAKQADPQRAAQWLTMGDRQFRAGDYVRASLRYEQALQLDPASATPRVRLAQVAIARGQYREAVLRLREAQAAEPGWLALANDVLALYPEPADLAAMLGRLETHLQAHPEDRDGWIVLGAQLYLAGRSRQAADAFQRLTDRRPDAMLAAFLDATGVVRR
jgi:hypothetical protein